MKMRILMVAAVDPAEPNASVLHIGSVARAFADCGHEVEIVMPAPSAGRAAALAGDTRYFLRLWPYGASLGIPRVLFPVVCLMRLLLLLRTTSFDLIYVRSAMMTWVVTVTCRLLARAVVVSEHNGWISDEIVNLTGRRSAVAALAAWFQVIDARASHGVRAVTAGLAELLVGAGVDRRRVFVIGNGTDTRLFYPIKRLEALAARGLSADAFYLGFIGNLAPWQGVGLALDALPRVREAYPEVHLIIAGSGRELAGLKKRAAVSGLSDAVHFLGSVPLGEANQVVNCFDVAIAPFTSGRNTRIGLSPMKIRDYAAAGRAILASDIPGISAPGGESWITVCVPDSAEELAAGIIDLVGDRRRLAEMGTAARRHAEREFDWVRIAGKILSIGRAPVPEYGPVCGLNGHRGHDRSGSQAHPDSSPVTKEG